MPGRISVLDYIPQQFHASIIDRTSIDDVTVYIQEWMDFLAENNRAGYWPAGIYNSSAPLYVTRVNPVGFRSSNIVGDGGGYVKQLSQTTLLCNHQDGPGLIIDQGRGVILSQIQITGLNTAGPTYPNDIAADYQSVGSRISRYSPYCGIALDATNAAVPPDGGYPGLTYAGAAGGCKNIRIDNCSVRSFIVGIMLSPGLSVQAEQVIISNSHIGNCEYGYSVGQPQARACVVRDTDLQQLRNAVTGTAHGQQQGAPPSVERCQFVQIHRGAEFSDQFGAGLFIGNYYEIVNLLATFGTGGSSIKVPLRFSDCSFNFTGLDLQPTPHSPILLESDTNTVFDGCQFKDKDFNLPLLNFVGSGKIRFVGCVFASNWRNSNNNDAAIAVVNQQSNAEFYTCQIVSLTDNTPLQVDKETANETVFSVTNITNLAFAPGEITFDSPDAGSLQVGQIVFWQLLPQGISPNSWQVPAATVTDVTANTVTLQREFADAEYNETAWYGAALPALLTTRAPI